MVIVQSGVHHMNGDTADIYGLLPQCYQAFFLSMATRLYASTKNG